MMSLYSSVTGEHNETEVSKARIEFLESQNKKLQSQLTDQKPKQIETVSQLVRFIWGLLITMSL